MKTNDKTDVRVIYIKITLVDEAYDDIHPDLIVQDIMPSYTTGFQWGRVEAMPMGEVRRMLHDLLIHERDVVLSEWAGKAVPSLKIVDIAAKYGINLNDHGTQGLHAAGE